MNYITEAMQMTLDDCPWIKIEEVKRCIRCDGSGYMNENTECKRCQGTGIEDHQDLTEKPK